MDTDSYTGLLNNAVILLSMGIVYDSLGIEKLQNKRVRESLSGFLIGCLGIVLMLAPWEMAPGIFFDTRWILISLCGLFFGLVPTLIAAVMMVALRQFQGGAGAMVGSLVIILPAALGLAWRYFSKKHKKPINWWRLYLLGLLVQLIVLSCMFLMPNNVRFHIIAAIGPTLITIFPIGTMLMGLILRKQYERRATEKALKESEASLSRERGLLKGLIDALPDQISFKNQEGTYLGCNKAFSDHMGLSDDAIVGKNDFQLLSPQQAERNRQQEQLILIKHGKKLQYESKATNENGDLIYFEKLKSLFYSMDGSLQGILSISRDITERKINEDYILSLSQVVEQSPVSVVITNPEGKIQYVNSAFERITGYSLNDIKGKSPNILQSGETSPEQYQALWSALKRGDAWEGEFINKRKNGEIFWEHAHIAPIFNKNGEVRQILAVKQDITRQKMQEEKITQQAHFDSLTGLPNRLLSLNRLDQMLKEAERHKHYLGVLFLDLDNFKKVNDTLGHMVGDQLLIEAANRLRLAVRAEDTVGRLGGDEFIVLLGHLNSPSDAQQVAKSLLAQFREPLHLESRDLLMTTSIGIAIYPNDGESPAELLRNADAAMYHSKDEGRNNYHYFTTEMNTGAERRLVLEAQLQGALGRNELYLLYQPVIDLKSKQMIGAEALLRWNNQTLGEVFPDEFIPIAEHTGLIENIGLFVLEEAINSALYIQHTHFANFRIAVNLSPRQFKSKTLVEKITQLLNSHSFSPQYLELEITEGVLMGQYTNIDFALTAFSKMGIKISMDDFGTGYSSLSYLRSYPFDILKIDKSFINDITVDPADLELVNATLDMARGLGLKVIAEGVETKEQMALLEQKNCDFAQGYLFSRPIPLDQLSMLLNEQTPIKTRAQAALK